MAKGKGKGGSSSGPRKSHGPKRKLFKDYKPLIKAFADAGLLNKYNNYESWVLSCNAHGKKNASFSEFKAFSMLTMEEKKNFFKSLSKQKIA